MITTPIGKISITLNGEPVNYVFSHLEKSRRNFNVDGRFKIELETRESGEKIVECILDIGEEEIQGYSESGEELELISFQQGNTKLSIGTIGDISGIKYEYESDRLRLKIDEKVVIDKIVFYIAWIMMCTEMNDIHTWFAADPTLDI